MKPIIKRCLIVTLIISFILLYAFLSYRFQAGFICVFYQFTGWYCPGCGIGRSVLSLLNGDWMQAFRYNVLLMPFIIPGVLLLLFTAWQYIKGVSPQDFLIFRITKRFGIPISILLLVYGFLRNILDILAPTML